MNNDNLSAQAGFELAAVRVAVDVDMQALEGDFAIPTFEEAAESRCWALMALICRSALASLPPELEPLTPRETTQIAFSAGYYEALWATHLVDEDDKPLLN